MLKSNLWKELKQLVDNFNDICNDDEKLKLPLIYRKATLKDLKKEISKVRSTIQIKIESYRKEKEDDKKAKAITIRDNLPLCPICIEPMDHGMILSCKHKFHHACIRELFFIHLNDKCPLCRKIYIYPVSKNHRSKKRLKTFILNKYSKSSYKYDGQKISCIDVMKLFVFCYSKGINLHFLNMMAFYIKKSGCHNGYMTMDDKDIIIEEFEQDIPDTLILEDLLVRTSNLGIYSPQYIRDILFGNDTFSS